MAASTKLGPCAVNVLKVSSSILILIGEMVLSSNYVVGSFQFGWMFVSVMVIMDIFLGDSKSI